METQTQTQINTKVWKQIQVCLFLPCVANSWFFQHSSLMLNSTLPSAEAEWSCNTSEEAERWVFDTRRHKNLTKVDWWLLILILDICITMMLQCPFLYLEMNRCEQAGRHCTTVRDGYYILGPVCVALGCLILVIFLFFVFFFNFFQPVLPSDALFWCSSKSLNFFFLAQILFFWSCSDPLIEIFRFGFGEQLRSCKENPEKPGGWPRLSIREGPQGHRGRGQSSNTSTLPKASIGRLSSVPFVRTCDKWYFIRTGCA